MPAPPSEAPKGPRDKKNKNLKYLRPEDPESPLPGEVVRYLKFIDKEEERGAIAEGTIRKKLEIFQSRLGNLQWDQNETKQKIQEAQGDLNRNMIRRSNLDDFRKLLFQHADNPNVKELSDAINQLYKVFFDTAPPVAFEEAPVDEKTAMLLKGISTQDRAKILEELDSRNEGFDDVLDKAQTDYIVQIGKTNNPNTLFEAYITAIDRYKELTDKILLLPKPERDKNVDVLLGNVAFYESFLNGEFEKRVDAQIDTAVKTVLDNQETQFKGFRGLIQKGIEGGTDFAIDHVSAIFGEKGSFARNVFIVAAKTGRDLSKPVEYSAELVQKISNETKAQLKEIGKIIDKDKVEAMKKSCIDLKANPDTLLKEDDQEEFRKVFLEFLPVSTGLIERTLAVQSDLIHQDYVLSHGEKNSQYEKDWQMSGKIGNWDALGLEGKHLFRLLDLYSPFGVFLPTEVQKKDKSPVYLRSAYKQGWFKEHPYLSTMLQTVLMNETILTARVAGGFVLRAALRMVMLGFIGRGLYKLGAALNPVTNFAVAQYLGIKAVKHLKLTKQELEIEKKINSLMEKYPLLEAVPESEKNEVRELFLINEIYQRKQWFGQPVGYDLSKFGVGPWKRSSVGNLLEITTGFDTMEETGAFREAVFATNRKLVLLGFEPYEIEEKEKF